MFEELSEFGTKDLHVNQLCKILQSKQSYLLKWIALFWAEIC